MEATRRHNETQKYPMAKVEPSLIEVIGTIDDRVYYKRFGKYYSRNRAKSFNDHKSEAQLRQRALFKAMQHTSSLLGSILQRGLSKEAHSNGHTEANEFASLNKQHFVFDDGQVRIDYPRLLLSTGQVARVKPIQCSANGLHVELRFDPCLNTGHSYPDDVVHIYAVEFQVEVCQLVVSVSRESGSAAFDLPDLTDDPDCKSTPVFHLYAIVEAANTACIPTLSTDEKKSDKSHRNINRRVSPTVFIGKV